MELCVVDRPFPFGNGIGNGIGFPVVRGSDIPMREFFTHLR